MSHPPCYTYSMKMKIEMTNEAKTKLNLRRRINRLNNWMTYNPTKLALEEKTVEELKAILLGMEKEVENVIPTFKHY